MNMQKLFGISIDGSLVRLALSTGSESCYLAYTASVLSGEVELYDLLNKKKQKTILAHKNPVIQMKFNEEGNLLAIASAEVLVRLRCRVR